MSRHKDYDGQRIVCVLRGVTSNHDVTTLYIGHVYSVCLSCMVLSSSLFGLHPHFHTNCSRWAEQPYKVQLHPSPPSWGASRVESCILPNVSEEHSRHSAFCSVFLRLPVYLNIHSTGKLYWDTVLQIPVWILVRSAH